MGEEHAQAKRALRPELRAARRMLPGDDVARRSARVCARLHRLEAFRAARRIVLYAPVDGEVDVSSLATIARDERKALYYPRTTGTALEFVGADARSLRPGRFGVPEPPDGPLLESDADGLLFVVPGLAFDLACARLGRGNGCYDRALADHPDAVRLGVAFELQIMPRLPAASWDVPMSAVVTDARLIEGAPDQHMKEISP